MTWNKERYQRKNGQYIPVPKEKGVCESCGTATLGRPDKKYCGDYCRLKGHRAHQKAKRLAAKGETK